MPIDDEEFNKQYSPRFWNKRMPEYEFLNFHMDFINKASEVVKAEVPSVRNVPYAEKERTVLDMYGVDLDQDAPIYVHLHGGYWKMLSKEENNFMAKQLWKSKIKTYVPEYDLVPKVPLEEIVSDIKNMASFVLKQAAENNARSVWIGGHCAGAHLSAFLLDPNWLSTLPPGSRQIFKGIILFSGIYDMEPLLRTEHNDYLSLDRERAISLSPAYLTENLIKKSLLPDDFTILVIAAENDSPEFLRQGQEFYQNLQKEYGKNVMFRIVDGVDHLNLLENLVDANYPLLQEIIALLKR